jgi:cytosine/adenosine deaminase-related metal-dependent hydrolase
MMRIRGGTVVTMDRARRIVEGDVVVGDDGAIVAVGEAPGAQQEIDARGRIVIPGFVQTHVHLCQTLFRNHADDLDLLAWLRTRIWPYEATLDGESMRACARLGVTELLLNGTTSILDMGTVHEQDEVFAAAEEGGLRLAGGKAMMDTGDGVPARLRESTRSSIDESLALAKRWHGRAGGRIRYAFAPRFVLSCTDELLREVARLSERDGLLVHTHASEQLPECELVRRERGDDNIAHLAKLGIAGPRACLAHCVHPTEREVGLIVERGTRVLHCPSSNLKLGSGIAPVADYLARSVCVSLGADGAPCNNQLDPWIEMRLAALLQKARAGPSSVPAETALALATIEGARALGLDATTGSIEVGKRADLVVVNPRRVHATPAGSPYSVLVYSGRADMVEHVLVDGRVVVAGGRATAWDERSVLEQADRALARVLEKMP